VVRSLSFVTASGADISWRLGLPVDTRAPAA
jgi:hypothetical protein